jgi:hypothetical protein
LATAHPIKFVGAVVKAIAPSVIQSSQGANNHQIEKDVLAGNVVIPGLEVPEEMRGILEKPRRKQLVENSTASVLLFISDSFM